jgi:outer membrane lipoprotein SlyB
MSRTFPKPAALLLATLVFAGAGLVSNSQTANKTPATSDVKIRQRIGMGDGGAETVLYIKGPRMRNEMGGGLGITTIVQCDLKRTLTINEKTKTYMISPTDAVGSPAADGDGGPVPVTQPNPQQQPQRGGVVNITNTITDTGERKEMFGFTARHIKTSMVKTASPEACDKDMKVETDGWYIDFQYAFECPGQTQKYQSYVPRPQPGCQDEVRTKTVGSAKLGFPLLVKTTIYQPDGKTTSTTQEVLELSRTPLDAALFDVPSGYTLAKNMQELYGMGQTSSVAGIGRPSNSGSSSTTSSSTTSSPSSVAVGPKKEGVIRIGLFLPRAQVTAGDAMQAAEGLRNGFANSLKAPNVEVISVSTVDEARQRECDYVLSTSMSVKKGGGGSLFGRAIGNVAGSAAAHIPGGSSAGTAAARSATIAGVYTTAAIVSSIKAKDEVSLEYKLDATQSQATLVGNKDKAKANSDGEDVVSPMIQRASQAILAALSKR